MRFIATADLHVHNYTQFARIIDGLNSRLLDCVKVLDEIEEYIVSNDDIEAFLFLGDLFNSRTKVSIEVYHLVYERLKRIKETGVEIHILVGNHDQFLRRGVYHSIKPFSDIAHVIDQPEKFYLDKLTPVYAVPYIEDLKERKEAIRKIIGKKQKKQGILMIHTGVAGAKVSSLSDFMLKDEIRVEELYPEFFDLVLLGHYHKSQYLADNILYLGSPLQLNFGEREDKKGFWDIKIDRTGFKANLIETHSPKFVLIDGSEDEDVEFENNYVKVVLPEANDKDVKEIKESLLELGAKSVIINRQAKTEVKRRAENIKLGMKLEDMLIEYVKLTQTPLDRNKLIKIGKDLINANRES